MNILLITPPFTQLNTPYPATTVLKGFLNPYHTVFQCDLGIELINRIFTQKSLSELGLPKEYQETVEAAIRFLQGKDKTLATRIANETLLPQGARFKNVADLDWAFGTSGMDDRAKHLATLYIEDIADFIRKKKAPNFDLIRYAEQISLFAPTFDSLQKELEKSNTLIDKWMLELLDEQIRNSNPQLVGLSVPFPGCLYAALKCMQYIKEKYPEIKTAMGGGYANTELRSLTDKRLFSYADYLLLDDGELPLLRLTEYLENRCSEKELVRCFYLKNEELCYSGNDTENIAFKDLPAPDFSGLPVDKYLSLVELTNPMHKLWTDGFWNKMTVAHGCYWAKCAFCDTTLDYISRYETPTAQQVVDKMESILQQTQQSGFHFTDEALPPKLLGEIAEEILKRKLVVSFWGNIRFERAYTQELCELLSKAGCVAVSGGLEVASDRLLKLMNKGVSLEQAAKSCQNFTDSGIMVHAYLMYGFPSESLQETIDSLEVVRQMFELGLIQSAFWHRYAMTIHSPSGKNPESVCAKRINEKLNPFANNGVDFSDSQQPDLNALGKGLSKAVYNFMHGIGFEFPLQEWFPIKIPRTTVKRNYVEQQISCKTRH